MVVRVTDKNDQAKLDLAIDMNLLPEQWVEQPALVLHWATQLADAVRDQDQCKRDLAVVEAGLLNEMRLDPTRFGLVKVTDSSVAAAVQAVPDWLEANDAYIEARYRVNVLRGVVDALEHRKRALQAVTELWQRQWFADPTTRPKNNAPATPTAPDTKCEGKVTVRRRRRRVG